MNSPVNCHIPRIEVVCGAPSCDARHHLISPMPEPNPAPKPIANQRTDLAPDLDHVLAHTAELWDELRGQKIFITGATGFFGCWLLESFAWANEKLNLNAEVVALTRNLENFRKKAPHLANHPAIRFQIGDVRNFQFSEEQFKFVIHAATEASVKLNEENPQLMFDTIVAGTKRALDFAVHCGAKKFMLTSSGAVYGPQPPELTHIPENYFPLNSEQPTSNPEHRIGKLDSAYGEGKRQAEKLCADYSAQFGIETKIARCFAFVGPYLPLDTHFAIGNFIRDALRGGPIRVNGDGTPFRSYLYAADLAIWLWTILFRGKSGHPYNVGSSHDLPISKIAEAVKTALQSDAEVIIAQKPTPGKSPSRYVPDTTRAEQELNLRVQIPLQEAIRKTGEWNCKFALA